MREVGIVLLFFSVPAGLSTDADVGPVLTVFDRVLNATCWHALKQRVERRFAAPFCNPTFHGHSTAPVGTFHFV